MEKIVIIGIISLLVLVLVNGAPTECQPRSDDYLDEELSTFRQQMEKIEQANLAVRISLQKQKRFRRITANQQTETFARVIRSTREARIDDSMCSELNRTSFGALSVCPFEYEVFNRTDMYPRFQVRAKCACSKCRTSMNQAFKVGEMECAPIYRLEPVLLQGEKCSSEGFYVYEPFVEQVPIACTCQQILKSEDVVSPA